MFKDDHQACAVIRALLHTTKLARLWTPYGPTDEAERLLKQNGGSLSSNERVLLLSAWTLWNGDGGVTLGDIVNRLDGERTAPSACSCSRYRRVLRRLTNG
jgi:hypothetical protein